jgi:hypothetical protein
VYYIRTHILCCYVVVGRERFIDDRNRLLFVRPKNIRSIQEYTAVHSVQQLILLYVYVVYYTAICIILWSVGEHRLR